MKVLGLDISTSVTGWAIIDHQSEGRYTRRLEDVGYINLTKLKTDWFKKADQALSDLTDVIKKYNPDRVQIEENLLGFSPGFTKVQIIVTLARFNGIVSWGIYRTMKKYPIFIHPTTARVNAWGTSFKEYKSENKKAAVLQKVMTIYPEIYDKLPKNKKGDIAKEAYDIADAVTVACCLINNENKKEK